MPAHRGPSHPNRRAAARWLRSARPSRRAEARAGASAPPRDADHRAMIAFGAPIVRTDARSHRTAAPASGPIEAQAAEMLGRCVMEPDAIGACGCVRRHACASGPKATPRTGLTHRRCPSPAAPERIEGRGCRRKAGRLLAHWLSVAVAAREGGAFRRADTRSAAMPSPVETPIGPDATATGHRGAARSALTQRHCQSAASSDPPDRRRPPRRAGARSPRRPSRSTSVIG